MSQPPITKHLPIQAGQIIKSPTLPAEDQMARINQYTRRPLDPQEVFSFGVILCDNDIDRDFEAFSLEALHTLRELFLGKTGIFDHDPKGRNQTARIYHTEIRIDHEKTTATGQPYTYLFAYAYTVRSPKNADFILALDAGIQKEVSVGCSVAHITCSICGTDWKETPCEHTKGASYGKTPCYGILSHPTDAYEWSFVAIPAQKNAGVTKRFAVSTASQAAPAACPLPNASDPIPQPPESTAKQHDGNAAIHASPIPPDTCLPPAPAASAPPLTAAQWIHKLSSPSASASTAGTVTLSGEEVRSLQQYLAAVEQQTALAKQTIAQMKQRVSRMVSLQTPEVSTDLIKAVVEKMSLSELATFDSAYRSQTASLQIPPVNATAKSSDSHPNKMFKIGSPG